MKRWYLSVLLCLSCMPVEQVECERIEAQISCPGMGAVALGQNPGGEGSCEFLAGRLLCDDGEVYDLEGRRVGSAESEENATPTPGMNPDSEPTIPKLPVFQGQRDSGCTVQDSLVTCGAGTTATLPPGFPKDDASCTSRVLPGHGRRVVCVIQMDDVEVLSPATTPEPVTCERLGAGVLKCSEGSGYIEPEGGPLTVLPMDECLEPILEAVDAQLVAQCLEELSCTASQLECFEQVVASSPTCERALTPELVCETGERFRPLPACQLPEGGLVVKTVEDAMALARRGCTKLRGDLLFKEVGADALVFALADVVELQGSLLLEDVDFEGASGFEALWPLLPMWAIFGDLVLDGAQGLTGFAPPEKLWVVAGSVLIQNNSALEVLSLGGAGIFARGELRVIGANLQVSTNASLSAFAARDDLRIDGSFAWLENPKVGSCGLLEILAWGYAHAQALLHLGMT